MEILQELPLDQWPKLQESLRALWPYNLPGYYALYLHMNHPRVREAFQFKVYCPHGDTNNGFIATSVKDTFDCIAFSLSKDTSKLKEALLNTKLIDWNKVVFFDLVSSVTLECYDEVHRIMGFSRYQLEYANMYLLDWNTKPFEDVRLPPNTYLAPVNQDRIHRVVETWPYRDTASIFYFSTLASNGLSYGLYSSVTGELLAWIFLNEYYFLCHLYCEEEYRRKGYSEFLVKTVCNDLLRKGCDIYTYVVEGNHKSSMLFLKLGFKVVDNGSYLYVQK